jgi:hypothetical protein
VPHRQFYFIPQYLAPLGAFFFSPSAKPLKSLKNKKIIIMLHKKNNIMLHKPKKAAKR